MNEAVAAAIADGGGSVDLGVALTALKDLVPAANKVPIFTGPTTADLVTINPYTQGLLANNSAAAWRSSLNLAVGSTVQAWDIVLDILSTLTLTTDTIPYFTDSGHGDTAAFTALGRDLLGAVSQASAQTAIGVRVGTQVQAYSDNLKAIAGLTTAPDKLSYWTGEGDAGITDLTGWARSWLALPDTAAAASLLNAQTKYAALDFIGTLGAAKGRILAFTDSALGALNVGTDGKIIVADSSAPVGLSWQEPSAELFNLGTMADQNSNDVDITGGSITGIEALEVGSLSTDTISATGGSLSGVSITGLPAPVNDQDAATKKFVIDSIGA